MFTPCNNVQHGEDECYLNTIHSCVIYYWPDVVNYISLFGFGFRLGFIIVFN